MPLHYLIAGVITNLKFATPASWNIFVYCAASSGLLVWKITWSNAALYFFACSTGGRQGREYRLVREKIRRAIFGSRQRDPFGQAAPGAASAG